MNKLLIDTLSNNINKLLENIKIEVEIYSYIKAQIIPFLQIKKKKRKKIKKKIETIEENIKEIDFIIHNKIKRKIDYIINKKTLNIAFVGDFSSGKSSIINSLLGEEVLITGGTPTTAVVSKIRYGNEYIEIIFKNRVKKNISKDEYSKITHKNDNNIINKENIKYINFYYPNEILKDITLIDTPGFSTAKYKVDDERTFEIIKEDVNVIMYVLDTNWGTVKKSNLEIISKIKEINKNIPIFIIVNKVETKIDRELQEIKEDIKKYSEIKEIFLYSAKCIIKNNSNNNKFKKYEQYKKDLLNKLDEIKSNNIKIKYFSLINEIKNLIPKFEELSNNIIKFSKYLKIIIENNLNKIEEINKEYENLVKKLYESIGIDMNNIIINNTYIREIRENIQKTINSIKDKYKMVIPSNIINEIPNIDEIQNIGIENYYYNYNNNSYYLIIDKLEKILFEVNTKINNYEENLKMYKNKLEKIIKELGKVNNIV